MRLNHLDILEQCFHDKFRGYNKQEVDTFLHLVADDFKEMAEEIRNLNSALEQKDRIIADLKKNGAGSASRAGGASQINPEMIKEKAKQVIQLAREQAERHKKEAAREVLTLKKNILKLKKEQNSLIQTIKSTAQKQLNKLKK